MGNWHRSSEPLEPSPLLKQSRQGADIAKLLEQSQQRSVVPTHRGQLWRDLLCVDSLKEVEPQDLFQHLLNLPLDDDRVIFAEACIQKDLDRVFPHCFGQARAEYCRKKYSVLLAYAQRCPDIGYESGMHFIAGVLLAVMEAEDAFWCLCSIIEKMLPAGFYGCGDHDYSFGVELELFQELLNCSCPQLAAHLADLQVGMELVLVSWFKSFFMCLEAPHDLKLRLMDSIFLQGMDGLHNVSLLLLKAEKSRFLQCGSFEEAIQLLAVLPIDYSGCDFFEPALPQRERLAGRREELLAARGAVPPRFPVRSYEIPWSLTDHPRIPLKRQRLVFLLLMALQRPKASASGAQAQVLLLPKVLWIHRILPFL